VAPSSSRLWLALIALLSLDSEPLVSVMQQQPNKKKD
jgi:hypothetical protein